MSDEPSPSNVPRPESYCQQTNQEASICRGVLPFAPQCRDPPPTRFAQRPPQSQPAQIQTSRQPCSGPAAGHGVQLSDSALRRKPFNHQHRVPSGLQYAEPSVSARPVRTAAGSMSAPLASLYAIPQQKAAANSSEQQLQLRVPAYAESGTLAAESEQHTPPPVPGEAVDMTSKCDPRYMCSTVGQLAPSTTMAAQTRLPVGIVCQPMALDVAQEPPLDVVNFGSTGIIRCKKCRAYVNPYVSWVSNGRQWRCNVCGFVNDVPNSYFCQLDPVTGRRRDIGERPELQHGSVEFVAPGEYMVRPPQPPVYVFCIDVSTQALASGLLHVVTRTVLECLRDLPGSPRTQIAVITFDNTVHFYNLKATLGTPEMICVSDLDDLFVPLPDDLLVSLSDSFDAVKRLLEALPGMHGAPAVASTLSRAADTNRERSSSAEGKVSSLGPPRANREQGMSLQLSRDHGATQPQTHGHTATGVAFGPALTAAYRVMGHIGGKLCVFISSLPSIGEAALVAREQQQAYGTDQERFLLRAEQTNGEPSWYETRAVEFSRLQICVELFLTSPSYTDVATLGVLPKITAGQLYYFPAFLSSCDGMKLSAELRHVLTRPTGFEAVMRVRCTRGLRVSAFRGNYYIRGHDLLALPNCSPQSVFALELCHDDHPLTNDFASIQASLLYTTSSGERRIRVHTMVIPVAKSPQDVLNSADIDVVCNVLAKSAVDLALKQGLETARTKLQQKCVEIVAACRSAAGNAALPPYARGTHVLAQRKQHLPDLSSSSAPGESSVIGSGRSIGFNLPDALELLPLYTMSLLKSSAFRGGVDISADERSFLLQRLDTMTPNQSRYFIYPRLVALHTASADQHGGTALVIPPQLNLTADAISSGGVYLLDNSLKIYIWVGAKAPLDVLHSLFVKASSQSGELEPPLQFDDNGSGTSLHVQEGSVLDSICYILRKECPAHNDIRIIREGDSIKQPLFFRHLVEDHANFSGGQFSYQEFMAHIQRHS
mmetsp:Transcript_20221/g.62521  ORF Transcript_20221/g.62521 Transcript_20221/m.62521 type:complete len:998 (-) Transcript_20221:465-3458(-)